MVITVGPPVRRRLLETVEEADGLLRLLAMHIKDVVVNLVEGVDSDPTQ
jgi:hypothetical protein